VKEGVSRQHRYPAAAPPREALAQLAWRLETPVGLAAMFSLALLVRLAIAPYVGFYEDLHLFQTWATRLGAVGTHRFYVPGQFQWESPGYLYVLWAIGNISAIPGYLLLKLPSILADLGLAWIAGTFAARLAPVSLRERWPVRALVVAAVLFNPAVIALSAVWGQVDALPTLLVLWSLLLLFTGPKSLGGEVAAFLLFAVAIAIKPQAAFALPIMLYALYRRYIHGRTRTQLVDGALSIALIGTPALALWAVSGLAFGLDPLSLLRFNRHWAAVYPYSSANAFNLWGAIGFWRHDSTGDHVLRVAGIPAYYAGTLAFVAVVVLVLWRVHRGLGRGADEARVLTVATVVVSLFAFTLLTRVHERYMFLSLVCLSPLVFARPLRLAYAAMSGLFVLNLWYAFAYYNTQDRVQAFHYEPWFNWIFGGYGDTWQNKCWSLAVTAVALAVAVAGLRWAERSTGASEPLPAEPHLRPAPWLPRRRRHEPEGEAASSMTVERAEPTTRVARWLPAALVGLTCVFGLFVLRSARNAAPNLNDSAFHLQMVRWASGQIHEGRIPLDGWFPDLSLGSSFFHHYQSLSETLTAYASHVFGASNQTTYDWILYLLLALWPISVYLGARLLGWDRWTAVAAAMVSPLIVSAPGYGYEHGSYTWQGYGVYSQLWAMWLLPICWGLTWRAVARGRYYAAAATALALTVACHFITGYLALLTVGVWALALGGALLKRVGRAALVVGGSLLIASWVLVPLVADTKWTTKSEFYKGSIFNDSYGAQKVLGWLFTGKLFDNTRWPVVTILFFIGVLACLARARRDARARALLGALALGLFLFFGRRTWGSLLDVFPGFHDVQIHRFVIGVDLAAILLAGVGLGWLARTAFQAARPFVPGRYAVLATGSAVVLVGIGALSPAWSERAAYDQREGNEIRLQRAADATDGRGLDRLIDIVKARGDGRAYAGLRSNWGKDYRIGAVPVYAWFADRDVDAIGFTFRTVASLSNDVEAAFDETNPADYQMFNVRYLILPSDRRPAVAARRLASSGRHRLWEVPTSGYFQVVDRAAPLAANRTNLMTSTRGFMGSNLASRGIYPGIAFAGAPGPPPTFAGAVPPAGPAGTVVKQSETTRDGVFSATVVTKRPALVLLKASYDPRWAVTVDGLPDKPVMMAPSLVGVQVPPGRHAIRFRYVPYGHYPLLLTIGLLALIGLVFFPRRSGIARRLTALRALNGEAQFGGVGERLSRLARLRRMPSSMTPGHPLRGRPGPTRYFPRDLKAALADALGRPLLSPLAGLRGSLSPALGLEAPAHPARVPVQPAAPPPGLREHLAASRATLTVVAVTIVGIFLSVLIVPYANADDYSFLWMANGGGPNPQFGKNILDSSLSEGRPLLGLLNQGFFSAAGTIDNLRFVRLFAVLGIVALALLLHWALVRAAIKRTPAALIAVLVCSMPAFQVYASWTTAFTAPTSTVLAGGASMLTAWAVDSPRGLLSNRLLGAGSVLLASLLIYQPTAMFFWVFLAVALVGARYQPERARRLVRSHFAVAGGAFAIWYGILKLSIYLVGKDATGGHRSTLAHDAGAKLRWFWHGPLYHSLNLSDLTPSPWFAAFVGTVAAGGILLWLLRRGSDPLLYGSTGLALVPLSFLPNLVTTESWAPYRTQVSLSSLLALYFCLGALALWLGFAEWLRPRVSRRTLVDAERAGLAAALVFVAASAFFAARNVTTLIVEPNMTELRLMRSQVAAIPTGADRVAFVGTPWGGGLSTRVVYDEFGFASTTRVWVLGPAVDLILREERRLTPNGPRPTVFVYPSDATAFPPGVPLIDLRAELQRLR
jgi:Gpi18-like mannosyltransferase